MTAIGTRKMKIEIDGTARAAQVSDARFTSAEGDANFLTFQEADEGGGRDYVLAIKLTQDLAAGSLWREIFDNAGDDVVCTLMPYGNATPTVSEPHVEATCTITEPDGDFVGGEANKSNSARMTIEVGFPALARPVLVTS